MTVSGVEVAEVAPEVFRLALPLGIHGVPTVSAYLLRGDDADTLVDCGIAVATEEPGGAAERDGTEAVTAALAAGGSSLERLQRLVVAHAPLDHFGPAGGAGGRRGAAPWV